MMPAGQTKGEATREALMDAGFKVFAEKGYLRAQIGDIVREAGKSNGVFHIYFKSKEALLDSWIDRCDAMVPWYQADTDLLFDKARRFILESFVSLYERFGPVLEALDAAAAGSEHFAKRLSDIRNKADAGTARMIRQAQSEGRCVGIDPEMTAISIAAVISRTTAYWFRHRAALEARGFSKAALLAHLETQHTRMLDDPLRDGVGRTAIDAGSAPDTGTPGDRR